MGKDHADLGCYSISQSAILHLVFLSVSALNKVHAYNHIADLSYFGR